MRCDLSPPIYLYFLDLNLHYTQLFSSRVTPPASTDVSRFLSQNIVANLMHNFWKKINKPKKFNEQFSKKNILVFLLKKCNTRAERLSNSSKTVQWILYCMLTIFVGKMKQQMFYWLWKFKSNTLINNHFIIKYFKYMIRSPCAVAV